MSLPRFKTFADTGDVVDAIFVELQELRENFDQLDRRVQDVLKLQLASRQAGVERAAKMRMGRAIATIKERHGIRLTMPEYQRIYGELDRLPENYVDYLRGAGYDAEDFDDA